jgi:HAD superfamily hydrolase (TIGR01509 family)
MLRDAGGRGRGMAPRDRRRRVSGIVPHPLDAVIFDMDGLLLDTEIIYREAAVRACAALGLAFTDDLHRSMIGAPKEAGDALLVAHFGAAFDIREFDASFRAHFEDIGRHGIPLKSGAADLLDLLDAHSIPCAVATSTSRRSAEKHLKQAGVFERIGALVTRTDVSRGKPDPETFLAAAGALKARPAQCLALEDSFNGVRAAAAAGMATVMIPDLLTPTEDIRALCAAVLTSLADVAREIQVQHDRPSPR